MVRDGLELFEHLRACENETVSDQFEMDFFPIYVTVDGDDDSDTFPVCIDLSIIIEFYSILSDRTKFPFLAIIYLEILS